MDTVSFLEARGAPKPRLFAIATPGIFVFEKKGFSKDLKIVTYISFSDLLLLRLDRQSIDFSAPKITIAIQHPQFLTIASTVYTIHNTVFGDKPRRLRIACDDPNILAEIDKAARFETPSPLGDRFLALCMSLPLAVLTPELLDTTYTAISTCDRFFQFDCHLLSSPLIEPLVLAVAYDPNFTTLRLHNLNHPDFIC
jgi:hypothetical protein